MSTVQKGTVSKGTVSKGNIFPSELAFSGELTSVITSGASVSVNENVDADTAVYTATARDKNGVTSGFSFAISTGDFSAFTINSSTGVVTIDASPNFEVKTSYLFKVTATKSGQPTAIKDVTIAVNNLDEVAPTITSGSTATAIAENSGAGQVIYTVTATDSGDISGGVTFSKSGTDQSLISIDSTTGAVTLIANPDFETKSSYSFNVIATDAASNSSTQAVTLAITNVVDVAPTFTASTVTASAVAENAASPSSVAIYDFDTNITNPDSASFTLSVLTVSPASGGSWTIDSGNILRHSTAFDYEANTSYAVIIGMSYTLGDGTSGSTNMNLTVPISDVFDTGLAATGTLGRYSPTGGLYFHGYEDSQSLPGSANSHRGTLSPLSDSAFYSGATVKELGYGKSQYSSASGTEFKIALSGDTRSQSGFKLVFTDKNNVSRTFRTTDSNMYSESYNSFAGQTLYSWDVTDSDAQAVNVFAPFLGISGMSVGTSYTVVNAPYPAHSSGSPSAGNNSSSDRGQALISIGTVASSGGFFGGGRVIANSLSLIHI